MTKEQIKAQEMSDKGFLGTDATKSRGKKRIKAPDLRTPFIGGLTKGVAKQILEINIPHRDGDA